MQPLRSLIPFVACSLVHSHLAQYRRGVQVRQTAVSASSSVADLASLVVSESATSPTLSSAAASVTLSSIQSTISSSVSMPLSISEIISTDPTDSTPRTAASSTIQTTLTDPNTAEGNSLTVDSTATSPMPSIATTIPATPPTGTTQATAPVTTMPPVAPLKDCLGGTAACTFTPTSTASSYYAEMTPLGLPLENCNEGNVTVTGHLGGEVTITDNWSVEIDAGAKFDLPGELEIGLDVKTTFEKGKEVQIAQSFDYPIPPDTKAALVGSASFIGIFGSMEMTYHGSNPKTVNNVVYFKSAENPNPIALLIMIPCGQPWPAWNATLAVPTSGASVADSRLSCFAIVGLVITALLT
ncbi:hypothetical protein MVEN_02329000 [Mycena venus]|uniref:Uncharacterized protein n=1 Tax=Mycena venus TaxID=2733690 RepID=A0A8H6X3X0_9AGAR|nr:hypothetical protein MVEN_02329000 [Mycena venus]